jgi:hypothetical protein
MPFFAKDGDEFSTGEYEFVGKAEGSLQAVNELVIDRKTIIILCNMQTPLILVKKFI